MIGKKYEFQVSHAELLHLDLHGRCMIFCALVYLVIKPLC